MRNTIHNPTRDADSTRKWFGAAARAVLIVGTLAAILAVPVVGAVPTQTAQVTADCPAGEATAADARTAENRAAAHLAELLRLNAAGADVSRSVRLSVQNHLEQGRLHADNEKYCLASEQFATAGEQVRAELTRAYRVRAGTLLDRSAARIAGLEADGYHTVRLHTVTERLEYERARLAAADSYAETRAVHERAMALEDATADLPAEWRVTVARLPVSPVALLLAVVSVLVGAILGWHALPHLSPSGAGGGLEVGGR